MTSRPRIWPAIVIIGAAVFALGWVWLSGGEQTGQDRTMRTLPIVLLTIVLLSVWFTLLSRLPRPVRIRAAILGAALLTLAAGAVRIRGVTGDLVPIFEWRWASRAAPSLENLPPPPEPPVALAKDTAAAPSLPATEPPKPVKPAVDPSAAFSGVEYPQYLGANRDAVVPDLRLARDWTARPPRLVWRRRVGAGWSGFAVKDGLAITQEQRGGKEMVVAYGLSDGSPRWAHGDDAHYESTVAGQGPRATPTISRGRVFTLGSTGILNALDVATGRALWRRTLGPDNDAPEPDWGRSSSPLAVDDLVVVAAGGSNGRSLAAYHRDTGEPVWRAGDGALSYSSPHLATLAGVRQIVILNHTTVVGHDPSTGRVLWQHEWPSMQLAVTQPLVLPGDRALFSAGYGIGSRMLQIARDDRGELHATMLWASMRLKAKFTNLVLHGGFVYGLDDGVLVCLDPATGERRWKSGRYGHGQVILVGDLLLVQSEEGELVLVEPNPAEHRELGRFTMFAQKTWNPPALAGRYLLARNDVEAALFELPVER
jgi:outer membrane protein assembly factor BamB